MKIKSVSHVGITVGDFDRAVKWYHENFGFKLISVQTLDEKTVKALWPLYQVEKSSVKLGFLRAPKGQVVEIFHFSNPAPVVPLVWSRPGVTHFTLDVSNVPKWYSVNKNKMNFVTAPQVTDGTHWVFLKDPDGNLIELIDLKLNYFVIRWIGGIFGSLMKRTQYKKHYEGE